jgi:RNA-directed DNA polymerase
MLHLIKMWLKVPVEERDKDGKRRVSGGKNSTCGTPQGGPRREDHKQKWFQVI